MCYSILYQEFNPGLMGEEFSGYFVCVGAEKLKKEGGMTHRDGIQICDYLLKFELRDAFGFFWFLI